MGRKITDGDAVDVTAPASTLIEFGELYRIDGITGIAMDQIDATEVDKAVALEVRGSVWRFKTPAGIGDARGQYLFWTAGTGFKKGSTDLGEAAGSAGDRPVVQVIDPRNAGGYVTARLLQAAGPIA